jgi:bla regulator protein blaR1
VSKHDMRFTIRPALFLMSAATLGITLHAAINAQAQPEPRFEVASVKPSVGDNPPGVAFTGGRFRATSADVFSLIALSFANGPRALSPSEVVGAPDWTRTEHYDITAKVDDGFGLSDPRGLPAKLPALVRTLLQDRFKLAVHREPRDSQVYVLHALPSARFRRAAVCEQSRAECRPNVTAGRIEARSMSIEQFVTILSLNVGRTVINETGFAGVFEITLEWSPDQLATDKPSLFGALEEQLGLKLEAARRPTDVLVIDHVEKPTAD